MKKYFVKPGDTLSSIAKRFYNKASKWKELAIFNKLQEPDRLSVGETLFIPENDHLNQPKHTRFIPLVTRSQLKYIQPDILDNDINRYLDPLNQMMDRYDITSSIRKAHFLAQVLEESMCFRYTEENLYYSPSRLMQIFGHHFGSLSEAKSYAENPIKTANRVYANRLGNGDETTGDGWRYRGRGLIQLTGKNNYKAFTLHSGSNFLNAPDGVSNDPLIAVQVATWYWKLEGLNALSDNDDLIGITKRINGGLNGLDKRRKLCEKAKHVMGVN